METEQKVLWLLIFRLSGKHNFQNRSTCFCCWNIAFISRSRKERIFIWRKFNPFYQKCLSWPWLFGWNKDPLNFQSKDVFICFIISSLALENMMLKRQKLHHIFCSIELKCSQLCYKFWNCLLVYENLFAHKTTSTKNNPFLIYTLLKPFIQFNF